MTRPYTTFIGIDLGGSRGKSTAVATLRWSGAQDEPVWVDDVATRRGGTDPWCDDTLVAFLSDLGDQVAVAIDAPLTPPACVSCQVSACPGYSQCEVPATVWLRTVGEDLRARSRVGDRDRIAMVGGGGRSERQHDRATPPPFKQKLAPYLHRCAEVYLHYTRAAIPRESLSQGTGPVSARAAHLARVLAGCGYRLNHNLLEVSPRGTVHALFGPRLAKRYKRDADPWNTRANIIETLTGSLRFAPRSRMSREDVLRNDHCFDALLSGYTAYLWARDGWQIPSEAAPFADTGFLWVPPQQTPPMS